MKFILPLLVFCLVCVLVHPAGGEYYQYRDESGNLHFTDDKSQIPEDRPGTVKAFESVTSESASDTEPAERTQSGPSNVEFPASESWNDELKVTVEELDAEKAQLDQMFQRLQEEREALEGKNFKKMSDGEKTAHQQKIDDLNSRIEKYHERRKAFLEKVEAFNSTIKEQAADSKEDS